MIYGAIILSVIGMATEHYQMHDVLAQILRYLAYASTTLFLFEAVVKLIGLGKFYFYDRYKFSICLHPLFAL